MLEKTKTRFMFSLPAIPKDHTTTENHRCKLLFSPVQLVEQQTKLTKWELKHLKNFSLSPCSVLQDEYRDLVFDV